MEHLTSIVAVNHDKIIGAGNALPWRLKSDLKFFRAETLGNVVLMGRKTYDSLGNTPLKGRFNVVVSHSFGLFDSSEEAVSATGIEDALFRASRAPKPFRRHYVIGGASMYDQLAPFVDRYLITLVDKEVPDGDTFFDDRFLKDQEHWELNELFRKSASDEDEASFTVFEVLARDPAAFAERRREAIARGERQATAGQVKRLRGANRRSVESTPMYSML
ncbi:MAG TPA: dihydrofolate reductase [Allosphingosinicella sp.]|nr:dihydrofolate reductase [Allosphingosinicella sp.]